MAVASEATYRSLTQPAHRRPSQSSRLTPPAAFSNSVGSGAVGSRTPRPAPQPCHPSVNATQRRSLTPPRTQQPSPRIPTHCQSVVQPAPGTRTNTSVYVSDDATCVEETLLPRQNPLLRVGSGLARTACSVERSSSKDLVGRRSSMSQSHFVGRDDSSSLLGAAAAAAASSCTPAMIRARTPPRGPTGVSLPVSASDQNAAAAIAAALFAGSRESSASPTKSERSRRGQIAAGPPNINQHAVRASAALDTTAQFECIGDEESLCEEWEAWAQAIVSAVEDSTELPEPPRADVTSEVTPTFVRVLEASTMAAAALARNGAEAEGLRIVAKSLDSELARARADIKRLQVALNDMSEEFAGKPCSQCEVAQRRIAEISEEAERAKLAKSTLLDADALRRKEIEDAWCAAAAADAKHRRTLALLKRVLTDQGGRAPDRVSLPSDNIVSSSCGSLAFSSAQQSCDLGSSCHTPSTTAPPVVASPSSLSSVTAASSTRVSVRRNSRSSTASYLPGAPRPQR